MDLKVLQVDEKGKVTFGFGTSPKKATGKDKMIQVSLLKMLKTPGQDVFSPHDGGGLYGMQQGNIDQNNQADIISDLSTGIKKSETELISDQMDADLPSSERLQQLSIASVQTDQSNPLGYDLRVEVIGEDEDLTVANVNVVPLEG